MKRLYTLQIQHGPGSVELTFDMDADAYRAMTEIEQARDKGLDTGARHAPLTVQALGRIARIDALHIGAMMLTCIEVPDETPVPETLGTEAAELPPNVTRFTPLSN